MPSREYSNYQKKIIQRYYDSRDDMDFTRLSELVTNLFLAEGKKKDRLWKNAAELMTRLNVPASRIAHVVKTADAKNLAEVVSDIQKGLIQPAAKDAGASATPKPGESK